MKHAHAEILHRLVDDCTLKVWVWESSQVILSDGRWIYSHAGNVASDTKGEHRYSLGDKPTSPPKRYAMVEGVKVPMTHLTVAPEQGRAVFIIRGDHSVWKLTWYDGSYEKGCFAALNCYATEADAQEAATAWAQARKSASERAK